MEKSIYNVKVLIPSIYGTTFDNIEDWGRATILDLGDVVSTPSVIKSTLLSYKENKKELFEDFKRVKETFAETNTNFNLGLISADVKVESDLSLINEINFKYKLGINKLINIFYEKMSERTYEINLARGIDQIFISEKQLETLIGDGKSEERINVINTVYDENKFDFTEDCIQINERNLVEL